MFFKDSSFAPLPEISFIILNQPCKSHRATVSNSILHIANQCKNYGVKEASISSVTCTTLVNSDIINDVNNLLRNKCQTTGYHSIDNSKSTTEYFGKTAYI